MEKVSTEIDNNNEKIKSIERQGRTGKTIQ